MVVSSTASCVFDVNPVITRSWWRSVAKDVASAPSCGARRMADSAAHLVDEVLPKRPIRQWVLSVPFPLRYLLATNPQVMSRVLTIVHRGAMVKSGVCQHDQAALL